MLMFADFYLVTGGQINTRTNVFKVPDLPPDWEHNRRFFTRLTPLGFRTNLAFM